MVFDHGLLHRMQRALVCQPFDRADGLAVDLRHKQDTGVQRAGAGGAILGHDDGAGTAVAFVTALFGAGQAAFFA